MAAPLILLRVLQTVAGFVRAQQGLLVIGAATYCELVRRAVLEIFRM